MAGNEPNPAAYGHMPAPPPGGRMPTARPPLARPRAMDLAVRLMQAGGVLALVSVVLTILTRDSIRDQVAERMRKADSSVTQGQIDSAMSVGLAIGIIWGLFVAALWFATAVANGRGQSWARILASVFFTISAVLTILGFFQQSAALSKALGLGALAIGAFAMFCMWRPESTAFYVSRSGRS